MLISTCPGRPGYKGEKKDNHLHQLVSLGSFRRLEPVSFCAVITSKTGVPRQGRFTLSCDILLSVNTVLYSPGTFKHQLFVRLHLKGKIVI